MEKVGNRRLSAGRGASRSRSLSKTFPSAVPLATSKAPSSFLWVVGAVLAALALQHLNTLSERGGSLEAQLASAVASSTVLEAERDGLRTRADAVSAELAAARDHCASLEAELNAARTQSASSGAERDAARAQSAFAEAERDAARAQSASAEAERDAARAQSASAEAERDAARAQSASAEAERDALHAQAESLGAQLTILERRLAVADDSAGVGGSGSSGGAPAFLQSDEAERQRSLLRAELGRTFVAAAKRCDVEELARACADPVGDGIGSDSGCAVGALDTEGSHALHLVVRCGAPETTLALLVERGADLNAGDATGRTPLMIASEAGDVAAVVKLLALGANVHAVDAAGRSALTLRALAPRVSDAFLACGSYDADTNYRAKCPGRWRPADATIRRLVEAGANAKARDGDGLSALDHWRNANKRGEKGEKDKEEAI